ncbi:hypothetical protein [Pseudomonas aeruginosa]|uniref:hypothetical protein n=1 Tax=Pseudomonas aeruginosa TaxID=287 RepID=UPI0015EFEA75|nr:hypothetical protein [Pseudomonas aeruginosa]MBA4993844.1 hypothetical protein [Pseudomonas aeruginosa]HBP0509883.1 hypothetical protein [Pseudomonas aeruginosa]
MISARVVSIMLACLLLVGLGAAGGVWLGARHFRPQLDAARSDLVACRAAWGELESAVVEQGRQVAALRLAGEQQRARDAAQAVDRGRQQAAEQYAGAQRLLSQRTAGEQCAAAEVVIDQELGL